MAKYKSIHTGPQIDSGVSRALNPDTVPTAGSSNLITSGGTKSALTKVETDLASIHATGSTNTTGATIASGTYFYLNGALVRAKSNIAVNATFTSGTNYEAVTAGGLNAVSSVRDVQITPSSDTELSATNHVQVIGNRIAVANMEARSSVDKPGYSYVAIGLPSGECWGCGYDTSGNAYPCYVQSGNLVSRRAIPAATWIRYSLTWVTT